MNKNCNKYYRLWTIVFGLFVASCAQISAPTGGNRDTSPPVILKSYPDNYSTNFSRKEIKIEFNEWIQPLSNPDQQVIISPRTDPSPKIEIARNELTIKLKDILQPNTTYSIFFGDNIKDNNEGNAYSNFKYVFSTGNYIDSLKVKGSIKTMLEKIPENSYLLLYKEKEDSAFTKKRPYYISKIGNEGDFMLENVKEGDYRIYALSDKNGNYYYDLPTEAIGFTDSIVHLTSSLDSLNFQLFLPEDTVLRIFEIEKTIKNGILHLSFNRELSFNKDEITVTVINNRDINPVAFQEKDAKKMTVYFPKLPQDTAMLSLVIKNSESLIDTLNIRTESKNAVKPIFFFTDTINYRSLKTIETQPLKLKASYYSLGNADTSKIRITDTAGVQLPFTILREDDLQTYTFTAAWISGMIYKLSLFDSVLSDLAGNYSKSQDFSFYVTSSKKAGNLLITYNLPTKTQTYIAIFKDNSGKVLDKRILRDSQTVKINYGLQFAGTYSVEVIEDANDNGIWNSGNFAKKTLPEKIYKEIKPVIIKENWDAEEIIEVDFSVKAPVLPKSPEFKKENTEKIIPGKNGKGQQ